MSETSQLASYRVWDRTTRWFHWINVVCVIGLFAVGLVILNADGLGVTNAGKIALKSVHVSFGYVFALNLAWRIVWGFVGGRWARWRAILPGGEGFGERLRAYARGFGRGAPAYLGHNPLGRIAVTVLLALLLVQAATGLVLAGTDIYWPPFGGWIAEWVAAAGTDPATLVPYDKTGIDQAAWDAMRAFRAPFITVHYWNFWLLCVAVAVHVIAVVVTEIIEGGGLVTAMFTGRKTLARRPADLDT
jgi:Ni/Fe-hydrogenase 1 B-type cytochrome subunit